MNSLLTTILEHEGYAMLRPDLIVLDLKLSEIDGITVLQDIRGMDVETPVVALTRAGTVKTKKQARELGAAAFLEKDFLLHRLGEHVLRLLSLPDTSPSLALVELEGERILT